MIAAVAVALIAGCGSGTGVALNERAQEFIGGALSNFGGGDGGDTGARSTARDLAVGREFDFILSGFVVAAGTATTSQGAASTRFSGGMGQLQINGDEATVVLDIANVDPSVVDAQLIGYFSVSDAQRAVTDASTSFMVLWEIEFTEADVTYMLNAQQLLSGTSWVAL